MKKTLHLITLLSFLYIQASCQSDPGLATSTAQKFEVVTVADGLVCPWGMTWLPDGRMLVTERSGKILIIENDKNTGKELTGVPEVYANGQGGLLDIQLHPDYVNTGWIYLSYSKPGENGGSTAITRAKLQGNALVEHQLLYEAFPKTRSGVHFGSRMAFDKDGYLFFSVGERGEKENAQRLANDHGKIHRILDDGRIPDDNPYVAIPDARKSIWSYGHRNPQGLVFHPQTGQLWSHEHGPRGGDELNIVQVRKNYGWPVITYGINYDGSIITNLTQKEGMEQPVHQWTPSIAPCGMTFVNSDRYPAWKGNILIGSLSFRYLHRVVLKDNKVVEEEELLKNIGRVRHVAESPDGYLYVAVEAPGKIVKLMPKP
jgi:aldose sugar dehydrogenase